MTYLIAKYAVLLLLAAFLGFLLGRSWLRRSFVDVTESYDALSKAANNAPWQQLWVRLDDAETRMRQIVSEELRALPRPEAPKVDLEPLRKGIDEFAARIRAMRNTEKAQAIDLGPTNERIDRIEQLIRGLPRPELPEAVDLEPIWQRLDGVERAVRAIEIPPPPDLGAVSDRLQIIESNISRLSQSSSPSPGPRLLRSASLGNKDDLKRISGVGPKLERLLNDNGVYYFWQIAEWSEEDITIMDDRLDVFKGRISRDRWVVQARELAKSSPAQPDSAAALQGMGARA